MRGTRPTQPQRKSLGPPPSKPTQRKPRKTILWIALAVTLAVGFYVGLRLSEPILALAANIIQPPPPEEIEDSIRQSLEKRVSAKAPETGGEPSYDLVLDEIFLSDDGRTALLWLALRDLSTGEILETEPQVAVAEWDPAAKAPASAWAITLPVDADWEEVLAALPSEIVTAELRERQELTAGAEPKGQVEPKGIVYQGYKLPWAGGLGKRVTGSIGHFLIYHSCSEARCRYAYDFADGTMFPIVAAKGGTVYYFHDSCANGDSQCTNSLALKDESTNPTTYQLYLHLRKGSIPKELRKVGAVVQQGQYIGDVDDTGLSSGHHLHFHVTSSFYYYKGGSGESIPWGSSIDIRFGDVDTNNGVPRTCDEVNRYPDYGTQCHKSPLNVYVSGNNGAFPPNGNITSPAAGKTFDNPIVKVEGTANDDQQVTKVAVLVNYDGTWREAGDPVAPSSGRFSTEINLCEAGVPKGSFQMALRIWDLEGNRTLNYPGQRTLTSSVACGVSATITSPANNATLASATLPVSGSWESWAEVASVEVLARRNGDWKAFSAQLNQTNKTFSANINLCQAGFDAGPITLKLRLKDADGKVFPGTQGLRTIVSNYNCPANPPCNPGPTEIAIYSEPNYSGVCKVLGTGDYATASAFSPVGDNTIESIKVGALAHPVLFDGANFSGRTESLEASDANLADNLIGANTVSSLKVQQMSTYYWIFPAPAAPTLIQPSANLGRNPTSADSIVLTWAGSAGASQFQAKLTYPNGSHIVMPWRKTNTWSVGNLPPGTYQWWVMGGSYVNIGSEYERRSDYLPISFTVESGNPPAGSARSLPYADQLNSQGSDWTATGQWRWSNALPQDRQGYAFSNGTNYASGPRSGDLTSPPIALPAGSSYFTFDYWYDSESIRPWWDQRRVQISVDGGRFTDLTVLSEDPAGVWLTSAPIDLTPYAGKSVRLRFNFSTVDGNNNGFQGWMIDSLAVQTGAPPNDCPDDPGNNSLATAAPIAIGGSASGRICRAGETDYFRFSGAPGQVIEIDVDAMEFGSPLDPYLYLLDEHGNLVLENDDVLHTELRDSHISFVLPSDRPFYLRLRPWDHPSAHGPDYRYTIHIEPPKLNLLEPQGSGRPTPPFAVVTDAAGMALNPYSGGDPLKVNFYWHSGDWENDPWVLLGSDTNGADGWSWTVTPGQVPPDGAVAYYVEAVSRSGRKTGTILKSDTEIILPLIFR